MAKKLEFQLKVKLTIIETTMIKMHDGKDEVLAWLEN